MTDTAPTIWWVRRDMRLTDNPALCAAIDRGGPVIPVFLLDEVHDGYGALPRWRMGLGAEALAEALEERGSRLVLRRGDALSCLRALVRETGARGVVWTVLVDPDAKARDSAVRAGLEEDGTEVVRKTGHVLFDPWTVETKTGGCYRVYTPFWRAVKDRDLDAPLPAPGKIPAPDTWPDSALVADWGLERPMRRGADVVRPHLTVGERAAQGRLGAFMAQRVDDYAAARDIPSQTGTSLLSENLTLGEISARTCWHAGLEALRQGKAGAETFLKELVWRDFAHHLAYHTPQLTSGNWRPEWDAFPWNTDADHPHVRAWLQGRTGIRFVDAAMRELYVTGYMHNRGRMIVGSYLCKHLMSHWKIGLRWFADTLRDWDPASNAMGWQWVAGSGPDATPYFRVFNPVTQLDKFDKNRGYEGRWIAEGRARPDPLALAYFDAVPAAWGLTAQDRYPDPVVTPEDGRRRALDAYENRTF
ncbi:deoxyribodipyrimidine photolyase [Meridianimarinicoccus roseus]|uniref:Deoxyribodipyrimidine photolyase n=1 Tax=Meridianimarinicoccus roseus TaxID=2072018 RepID=A0A2V2L957_9RHOB|nr:deoxyribodipyrimidine photo-lyase [Meridianimarinicoccus roseus]PWR01940.1 deoxyribodipyrimidine photolyase [Meridianimarinicoccus roseus]